MFSGEYDHSLDEKGRIVLPKRFRDAFADGLYLTRGADGCLWLLPLATWRDISSRLNKISLGKVESRYLDRVMYSGSEVIPDAQGRFLLPAPMRDYANLTPGGPVTVLGVKNRVELWNPDRWRKMYMQLASPDSPIGQLLAEVGL